MKLLIVTICLIPLLHGPSAAQCQFQSIDPQGDLDLGGELAIFDDLVVTARVNNEAYVFRRGAMGWTQEAVLVPSDPVPTATKFGKSAAIYGQTIAIGAEQAKDYSLGIQLTVGAVYIFEQTPAGWVEVQRIANPEPYPTNLSLLFGRAVALYEDTLVIGATAIGSSIPGFAYVYERTASGWVQVAKLTSPISEGEGLFGDQVALHGDVLAVSSLYEKSTGLVHVFERAGTEWAHAAALEPSEGGDLDGFGRSVDIAKRRIVVGAHCQVVLSGFSCADSIVGTQGAAFVFERDAQGWVQRAKLVASDGRTGDQFGTEVAVSDSFIAVCAAYAPLNPNYLGAVYVFRERDGAWFEQVKLGNSTPLISGATAFGNRMAADGDWLVVGEGSTSPVIPFSMSGAQGLPLSGCPGTLRVGMGDTQALTLNAQGYEGHLWWMLGSFSGTVPGVSWHLPIPLNPDPYFFSTLQGGSELISSPSGTIGSGGKDVATLELPAEASAALAGMTVHHAYVLFDPSNLAASFVSNAAPAHLIE